MRPVAYLTSADMMPGAPEARADLFELEAMLAVMVPACRDRAIDLRLRLWDDPALLDEDFAAIVIGTPWDYTDRAAEFLDRMQALDRRCPVFNPPAALRWNADKSYLLELAARGLSSVPTVAIQAPTAEAIDAARQELGADEIVVKAQVGACAVRQVRLRPGDPLPDPRLLPEGAALVQPFLPAILDEGELSFIFCGGRLSHALQKRPAEADYRVQSIYGGREQAIEARPQDVALARSIVEAVPWELLHARVDLVRRPDGALALMELEIIEPYLYPDQGPGLGEAFAAALHARLGRP